VTFGQYIAVARAELRLTQAGLAALLDVDKQSVSNWECERNAPWNSVQARIYATLKQHGAPVLPRADAVSPASVETAQAGAPPCSRPSINKRILKC